MSESRSIWQGQPESRGLDGQVGSAAESETCGENGVARTQSKRLLCSPFPCSACGSMAFPPNGIQQKAQRDCPQEPCGCVSPVSVFNNPQCSNCRSQISAIRHTAAVIAGFADGASRQAWHAPQAFRFVAFMGNPARCNGPTPRRIGSGAGHPGTGEFGIPPEQCITWQGGYDLCHRAPIWMSLMPHNWVGRRELSLHRAALRELCLCT